MNTTYFYSNHSVQCELKCVCVHMLYRLDGKHVVFGSVVEGMNVLKSMEAVGSQSGATSKKVVIKDCGQL